MLAISVSGRKISEIAVRTRKISLVRCAIADSLVASRPSTTSLKFSEHVPDALGRVDDVVEVDVEVLGDVARLVALEVAERDALRPHDLAEVDDLLLGVGDVAHDVLALALEDLLLDALELEADLAQHRERGVDAVVDDLVEQVAGALGEQRVAQLLVARGSARTGSSIDCSGSLGSVIRKSGPTKMSTSAAFRRETFLS